MPYVICNIAYYIWHIAFHLWQSMMQHLFKAATLLAGLAAGSILALTERHSSSKVAGGATGGLAGQAASTAAPASPLPPPARAWRWALKLGVLLVMLGAGGLLVVVSGIVPIKASSGHWPITAWFLDFAKHRSVGTHSATMEAPSSRHLGRPGLVLKGAGHYETGCFPCHGGPSLPQPRIARAMTPFPPYLPPKLSRWDEEELFHIVKHGIKFTGMPAWPAQRRDDEVWAVVAFLRAFPNLDTEGYRRLAHGETSAAGAGAPIQGLTSPEQLPPPAILTNCARCHGVDGLGRGPDAFPKLAGQHPEYFDRSLQAYANGTRHSGIMEPVAQGLTPAEMQELARYYSGQKASTPSVLAFEDAAVERGKNIAGQGIPRQRVPACAVCHGPGAEVRNPAYPELAGQYADYLILQLELFQQDRRGGTSYAHLMRQVAAGLTEAQRREVALYYASLGSRGE